MMQEGKLVVVSGPSGVGKSTVCAELLKHPRFERVITCTTRPPRPDEVEGRHYHFLTREEFQEGIRKERFLEHASIHGHLYGTPREQVEDAIRRGKFILLNIDVQGAAQLRKAIRARAGRGDALVTIFLLPPDDATLARRLEERGTETPGEMARRLETAKSERLEQANYDHIITNDDLVRAVREVLAILGP